MNNAKLDSLALYLMAWEIPFWIKRQGETCEFYTSRLYLVTDTPSEHLPIPSQDGTLNLCGAKGDGLNDIHAILDRTGFVVPLTRTKLTYHSEEDMAVFVSVENYQYFVLVDRRYADIFESEDFHLSTDGRMVRASHDGQMVGVINTTPIGNHHVLFIEEML